MSHHQLGILRGNRTRFIESMQTRSDVFEHVKANAGVYGCTVERTAKILKISTKTAEKHLLGLVGDGYVRRTRTSRGILAYYFAIKDGPYKFSTVHFDEQIAKEEYRLGITSLSVREGAVLKVNEYTTIYGAKNRSVPLRKIDPHIGNGSGAYL
jgi:predicted DNA-binding transcriptional regulator